MKTIGLIGGMSWESSAEYYRIINQMVKKELGEPHSCECIMYSVDFFEIEKLQHQGAWDELTERMIDIARTLEDAGADLIILCTNTMHKMAGAIEDNITVPFLHIADAVAKEIKARGMSKVGLLGTKFTMEGDFYKERLHNEHEIDVIVPGENDRDTVHGIIYHELISGIIKDDSRNQVKVVIDTLSASGAEGVVLGCTEIPLLIKSHDSSIPVFDTTTIHAKKAVEFALNNA